MEVDDLKDRDFNRITDLYFLKGIMSAEDYESLTPRQRDCIQWAKRAFERLNKKHEPH